MRRCPQCTDLINRLENLAAAADDSWLAQHEALEDTIQHMISEHLVSIPAYDQLCPSCQDWKASATQSSPRQDPGVLMTLSREDLAHRAKHLIAGWNITCQCSS